jgi:hypothetical protein
VSRRTGRRRRRGRGAAPPGRRRGVARRRRRRRQRVRGEPMHLPEPAGVERKDGRPPARRPRARRHPRPRPARAPPRTGSAAARSGVRRGARRARHDAHPAVGGLHEVDPARPAPTGCARRGRSPRSRARSSTSITRWLRAANGPMRPASSTCELTRVRHRSRPRTPPRGPRRAPRAPARAAIVADGCSTAEPLERVQQHLASSAPAGAQRDVPEVGAAGAPRGRPRHRRPPTRAGADAARHRAPRRRPRQNDDFAVSVRRTRTRSPGSHRRRTRPAPRAGR